MTQAIYVHQCRIFWYERFCACFVLKIAGGEKGGSTNFKTKPTEPFIPEYPAPVYLIRVCGWLKLCNCNATWVEESNRVQCNFSACKTYARSVAVAHSANLALVNGLVVSPRIQNAEGPFLVVLLVGGSGTLPYVTAKTHTHGIGD